jgi:hypothetical protein
MNLIQDDSWLNKPTNSRKATEAHDEDEGPEVVMGRSSKINAKAVAMVSPSLKTR